MIEREYRAAALAADRGVAVARPIERIDTEEGRAILYPEIAGATLLGFMRRKPLGAGAALGDMVRLHRSIHACKGKELRPLKAVLRTDIEYGPADQRLKAAAYAMLDGLPDGDRLLHGDFHPGNIIAAPEGLTAIDWSKAARGDVTPDMLRTEMLLRFGLGPEDPLTNIARDWAARRYVAAYGAIAGDGLAHIPQWRAVVALAWLRARGPVRTKAFDAYLRQSLAAVGLL